MTLTRRAFGAIGAAALISPASALRAQEAEAPFVMPEDYLPTEVKLQTELAPHELHVDPNTYRMYWTQPKNTAIRYTVGIGRTGLYEPGEFYVGAKKEWPSWKPTEEMVERSPHLYARYAEEGMPGGPKNPLGARALYLFTEAKGDTFLRIHGTNDPRTIGRPVSNGCARLTNDQIVGLYPQVPVGTRVVLHQKRSSQASG